MKDTMKSWRTFRRMNGFERAIALESAAGFAATWVGLRLLGFRRWKGFLEWLGPSANSMKETTNPETLATARVVARVEESVARNFVFEPNCLEQSLVLWWLLRLRSMCSELRVGGRKAGDCFEAHAWVECCGAVLSAEGEGHLHFVPFDGPIPNWETTAQ